MTLKKFPNIILLLLVLVFNSYTQVDTSGTQLSSDTTTVVKKKHSFKNTVVSIVTLKPITSMSKPGKAALLSTLLPGLGQAYNKSYWKIPLVYAAIGGSAYGAYWYRLEFKRADYAYTLRKNPEKLQTTHAYDWSKIDTTQARLDYQNFTETNLAQAATQFRDYRDRFAMLTMFLYLANIVEAHVDAHMKNFNVSEDVALQIKPSFTPTFTGIRSNLELNFYFRNKQQKHENCISGLW